MESDPLEKREHSRRSRHREKETKEQNEEPKATSLITAVPPVRRRPDASVEARIDDAIATRKQHAIEGAGNAQLDYDEPEILGNYEYLDHTADIQIHSWGNSLSEALENATLAMFGYMTKLISIQESLNISDVCGSQIEVRGHDVESLVFAFLQEYLYCFHATGFLARQVQIERFDRDTWAMTSSATGECFDSSRHVQGTEIKAVTYSNLQVVESDGHCDIWVIVDI